MEIQKKSKKIKLRVLSVGGNIRHNVKTTNWCTQPVPFDLPSFPDPLLSMNDKVHLTGNNLAAQDISFEQTNLIGRNDTGHGDSAQTTMDDRHPEEAVDPLRK